MGRTWHTPPPRGHCAALGERPLPPTGGLQQNRDCVKLLSLRTVSQEGPWADGHPQEAQHPRVPVGLWGAARQVEADMEPPPAHIIYGLTGENRKRLAS